MMRIALFLLILGTVASAEDFTFKNRGKVVAKMSLEEILKKVPAKTVPIWEPHESVEKK